MTDLRYPIGTFQPEYSLTAERRRQLIAEMSETPGRLRAAVNGLSETQLDTAYRPGGWTVRQVVHHLADAQMNWYIRTKLALTEDEPTIKPYDEARWAELEDARSGPIEASLLLLDGLYQRWVKIFEAMTPAQWARPFQHPERGLLTLEYTLPMQVWHGRHHTAHIVELRRRMGW
jgi:uncharacterized damage-inducible protein DinB